MMRPTAASNPIDVTGVIVRPPHRPPHRPPSLIFWLVLLLAMLSPPGQLAAQGGPFSEQCQPLRPSALAAGDLYGCAIAVADGWVAVGSLGDDGADANAGAAYLFQLTGGDFVERQRLQASRPQAGAQFGWSVALGGSCALIGSRYAGVAGQSNAGSADLFCRSGDTWGHRVELTAVDPRENDTFGWSVALSGGLAAAGSPGDDDRGPGAGSVSLFERAGDSWPAQPCATLTPDAAAAGDAFGYAVALSGDLLAVGAPFAAGVGGGRSGAVYLFRRTGVCAWQQEARLTAGGAGGELGTSLALSGARLVAGAPGRAGGAVYTARRTGGSWGQLAPLSAPVAGGDGYGISVATGGEVTVAGAHRDDGLASDAGAAYFFLPGQLGSGGPLKFTDPAGAAGDEVGYGAATDGDFTFVGSYRNDLAGSDAGAVFACPVRAAQFADLSLDKRDGSDPVAVGGGLSYTIEVRNDGTGAVQGLALEDQFPAGVSGIACSCVPEGGASCAPTVAGGVLSDSIDLPAGSGVVYSCSATAPAIAGTICNLATLSDGGSVVTEDEECTTVSSSPSSSAQLTVALSAASGPVTAGGTITYSYTVTNGGPSAVVGAAAQLQLPGLTGATCSCVPSSGGACSASPAVVGGVMRDRVNLARTATATYSCTGTVAGCPSQLTGIASLTPPPGVVDPNGSDNRQTLVTPVAPVADLQARLFDQPDPVVSEGDLAYTLRLRNFGPCPVAGALVSDFFPDGLDQVSWSCAAGAGSSCGPPAAGSGDIDGVPVDLSVGGRATFEVTGSLVCPGDIFYSTLVNSATIAIPPGGPLDPDGSNNQATAVTAVSPACAGSADLAITMLVDQPTVPALGTLTYTIQVLNHGPSPVDGATLTDLFPVDLDPASISWSCTGGPLAACGAAMGTGDLDLQLNLNDQGLATVTVTAKVAAPAEGLVANEACIAPPPEVEDPIAVNDCASATFEAFDPGGGLSAYKRVSRLTDSIVEFEVVLINKSGVAQGDLPGRDDFEDKLPPGLGLLSATSDIGIATTVGNRAAWNGVIPDDGSVTILIEASRGTLEAGTEICNQGVVVWSNPGLVATLTDDIALPANDDPTCFIVPEEVVKIPTASPLGLAALALLCAAAALVQLRRRRSGA